MPTLRPFLLPLALLAACPAPSKDEDTTDTTDGVTDEETDNPDPSCVFTHQGTITADETWCAGLHQVTGDLYIEGGTVTVLAGAEVIFDGENGLFVGYYGAPAALVAVGDADHPIVFRGTTPDAGAWSGVAFYDTSLDSVNRLAFVEITGAGGNFLDGALTLQEAEVLVEDVTLSDGEDAGFWLGGESAFREGSANLTISGFESAGHATASAVASLPFATLTGVDNDDNRIQVEGGTLGDPATWSPSLPLVLTGDLYLEGAGRSATLTLTAGTEVQFSADAGLYVGYYGGDAGLVAEGTEEAPVVFKAASGTNRGAWSGIGVYPTGQDVSLTWTEIHHGGGNFLEAALQLVDATALADHLTIARADGAGFRLTGEGAFEDGSTALTVNDSDASGITAPLGSISIPSEDSEYTGNDADVIAVDGGTLSESGTWRNVGVPWRVGGDLYLEGTGLGSAVLTIEAGNQVNSTGGIYVSYYGGAAGLIAEGTADAKIWFSGTSDDPGSWSGIGFYGAANDSNCRLSYVDIGYGGGTFLQANLYASDANPRLTNVHLHDSEEYGLYLNGTANPARTNVTYADNASGDVWE